MDDRNRPRIIGRDGIDQRSLAVGNEVAAEILADLEPLGFAEATSEQEREECFRLRYRAVVELEMADRDRFPEGLERDDFDHAAVQILGRDGTLPIATCRIVLPELGRPLPLEKTFGLQLPEEDGLVEWGRVVVDSGYRGDGHSVLMGLAAQGWLSMRSRGYSAAIGATPERLIALLEVLGFAVTVLGPARVYWGEERYPIMCDARPTIPVLEGRWLAGDTEASS